MQKSNVTSLRTKLGLHHIQTTYFAMLFITVTILLWQRWGMDMALTIFPAVSVEERVRSMNNYVQGGTIGWRLVY
jgi:hypothetical protein